MNLTTFRSVLIATTFTFVLLFLLLSSVFLGLGVAIGLVRSLLLEFRD